MRLCGGVLDLARWGNSTLNAKHLNGQEMSRDTDNLCRIHRGIGGKAKHTHHNDSYHLHQPFNKAIQRLTKWLLGRFFIHVDVYRLHLVFIVVWLVHGILLLNGRLAALSLAYCCALDSTPSFI